MTNCEKMSCRILLWQRWGKLEGEVDLFTSMLWGDEIKLKHAFFLVFLWRFYMLRHHQELSSYPKTWGMLMFVELFFVFCRSFSAQFSLLNNLLMVMLWVNRFFLCSKVNWGLFTTLTASTTNMWDLHKLFFSNVSYSRKKYRHMDVNVIFTSWKFYY